jgi:hypothetical protein
VRLDDDQTLVAEVPNDRFDGSPPGSAVYVDLRNAKVFQPKGSLVMHSDELASL